MKDLRICPTWRRRAFSIGIYVSVLVAAAAAHRAWAEQPGDPHGRFAVVALRSASDVATTARAREAEMTNEYLGAGVRFSGTNVTWLKGRKCEVRSAETSSSARVDRNLSDLQIVLDASRDRRVNRGFVVDCLGRAPSEVWDVLAVDDRTLVARAGSSTTYLVLEMPLTPEESRRVKRGLRAAGFDPGPIEGPLDERARAAVAAFAFAKGAAYRFATGIITRNVLDALTAISSR